MTFGKTQARVKNPTLANFSYCNSDVCIVNGHDLFQIPVPLKSVIFHANQRYYSAVCLLASVSSGHTGSCRRFAVTNCVNSLESRAIVAGIVVLFSVVLVVQLSKKKRKPNSGHALQPRRRTSRHLGWSTHSSWIDMVVIMNPVGRGESVILMRDATVFVFLVSLLPFLGASSSSSSLTGDRCVLYTNFCIHYKFLSHISAFIIRAVSYIKVTYSVNGPASTQIILGQLEQKSPIIHPFSNFSFLVFTEAFCAWITERVASVQLPNFPNAARLTLMELESLPSIDLGSCHQTSGCDCCSR